MIARVIEDLQKLLPEQLLEVYRVIQAYRSSQEHGEITKGNLHYLGRFLGIEWDEYGQPFMKLGAYNENTYGVAQGGALYTFADIAIGLEIVNKLQKDEQVYTLEMKMNFIKKGTGDRLFAKTEFLRWGKTTVVAQCQIQDDSGEIVAHALGTFYKVKKEN
jgi:uncharacterized protein (TIGR00369 family)